jgi:hypothetical protein
LRSGGRQVRAGRGASLVRDDAGGAVIVEPGKRKGCVDKVRCEPFAGGAVACDHTLSLVGGKAGMVKAVQNVQGGLADPAAGEEVCEQVVAEKEHELESIQRGDRFKTAVGGPDSAASDGMDVRMEIEAVAVTLDCDDDAGKGRAIGGNLMEHLPERLPGRLAEQAEFPAVVFENGAQELGDGEDVLGMADLLQDVRVEPLREKQDALLLA